MNNLKFRAWDLKLNKFVYFDLSCCLPIYGNGEEFIVNQWTGIFDIKGVLIYEGDIVNNLRYKGCVAKIIFSNDESNKCNKSLKGLFGEYMNLFGFLTNLSCFKFEYLNDNNKAFYIQETEVIGNIYENHELLK